MGRGKRQGKQVTAKATPLVRLVDSEPDERTRKALARLEANPPRLGPRVNFRDS